MDSPLCDGADDDNEPSVRNNFSATRTNQGRQHISPAHTRTVPLIYTVDTSSSSPSVSTTLSHRTTLPEVEHLTACALPCSPNALLENQQPSGRGCSAFPGCRQAVTARRMAPVATRRACRPPELDDVSLLLQHCFIWPFVSEAAPTVPQTRSACPKVGYQCSHPIDAQHAVTNTLLSLAARTKWPIKSAVRYGS
jgi:hypothetical protein